MKKHNSVQGTFSRLFGKKHAGNNSTSSLYATNPPWIFTQEVNSDNLARSGQVDGIYYGDNRFGSMTDSGTATLKPRPRVRPLLTFLPLNAQEAHGVAVPTPSVPEGFEDNPSLGLGSQINGNYRQYSSEVDLRPKAFEQNYFDDYIPPPPSIPPPPPPPSLDLAPPPPSMEAPPPPSMEVPPPPSMGAPPPPSMEVPPPPSMGAPPPPSMEVPPPPSMEAPPPPPPPMPAPSLASPSYPSSNLSSPSTPSPPDFIPPTPPLVFMDATASPMSSLSSQLHTPPFSNGVSKWKSEMVLNLRQPDSTPHNLNHVSPTTPTQKVSQVPQHNPDPHLTFPRSLKIPPPTPVRTSSISSGEKEFKPKDEQLPQMIPHSRPPLPANFTVRSASMVDSEGDDRSKATLEKPSILITESESTKLTSGTNTGKTELPSPDCASSNDDGDADADHDDGDDGSDNDNWKERANLDKLKHELSALLSSSCRKEDRQLDRIVLPKTKTSIMDSNQATTDESKQTKSVLRSPQPTAGTKNEKKEKIPSNTPSPNKVSTNDAVSIPNNKVSPIQANCVLKFKDELEALLSPSKDGGPPLALANLRHNPEPKKQITLQFGGSHINGGESKLQKPTGNQNNPTLEVTEKAPKTPSVSSDHLPCNKAYKPPPSPLKPKNELLVPSAPSPASSGPASPAQIASPSMDFPLLQYKTHRTRFGSVDSLASAASSQTAEDGPVSTNNNENRRDSAEHVSSVTSPLSEKGNSDILIHPVTGEKVEKGSPMALLLAAQQRAQRGRVSAQASRQNSCLSEKPPLKLSEKLHNSSQSETGLSAIYFSDSKPNSVRVIPKSPQKESVAVSGRKPHNGASAFNSNVSGLADIGQGDHKPHTFSSASEQCENASKLQESQNLPSSNRHGPSILVQGLLESSHLKQQGSHSVPKTPLHSQTAPENHTVPNNDELEGDFDYEIIPPPPEFSNGAKGLPDGSSKLEENHKAANAPYNFQGSDRKPNFIPSSYSNSYSLALKSSLENNTRPDGYSHQYSGGSYSPSYLSCYSSSRPLIKKRLYVTETEGSYGRAAMSSRSMSTPSSYGHNTMAFNTQAMEGMRRVNSAHRNVPNSAQGRRVSLELPGKMVTYNNSASDAKYKGQNGEYSMSTAAAARLSHGSPQYSRTANTFTVRPGTRQPISYSSYQGGLH